MILRGTARRRSRPPGPLGMRASQETTRSNVPAISYPVAFAISNVLFTLLAYVTALMG